MDTLKNNFIETAKPIAQSTKEFIKENANVELGSYTVEDVYSGMKGMIGLITETSLLDSNGKV